MLSLPIYSDTGIYCRLGERWKWWNQEHPSNGDNDKKDNNGGNNNENGNNGGNNNNGNGNNGGNNWDDGTDIQYSRIHW